jgi:hypothetical protein
VPRAHSSHRHPGHEVHVLAGDVVARCHMSLTSW